MTNDNNNNNHSNQSNHNHNHNSLLGHILINTYIPNSFKLRLKSASLFGYTQSGKCSKFACSKLASQQRASKIDSTTGAEETTRSSQNTER